MAELKAIVGLGNPGSEYTWTRHNLGFLVLEELAKRYSISFKKSSMVSSMLAQHRSEESQALLLMPLTFMNNSGIAVKQIVEARNITLDNLLVITDDFSLNFGQLRLRMQGSHGGHNGLKSISQHLGVNEYPRLRIGIGQPRAGVTDFVLGKFPKEQIDELPLIVERAADCVHTWLNDGIDKAMEQFNQRIENE